MESTQREVDSVVLAVDIGGTSVKGSVFVDGAESAPGCALPTFEGSRGALARAITTVTATLDTDEFIIGGGMAGAGPVLLNPLRSAVGEMMGWREAPKFSTSRLGSRAGLLGAALLCGSDLPASDRLIPNTYAGDP